MENYRETTLAHAKRLLDDLTEAKYQVECLTFNLSFDKPKNENEILIQANDVSFRLGRIEFHMEKVQESIKKIKETKIG